ncbi:hypothetical protein QWZ06_20545 [Chryseobacterium tructae]|uniref:Uncharacterized protein n=1 Tax=Chryseobacterium tructae TaxID=1037380 RepID=A0ABV7Y0M0_9FLAO|nr:hypothetical protein [Chryseobacterium tructae]MDN3694490.1 hypothetical protein [Chryseobacterium tructae]
MPTDFFFYFIIAVPVFFIGSGIFFFIQKSKIIEKYKQPDAVIIKNINGTITTVTKGGLQYKKSFQWASLDILLNQNSMFLFPRSYYIFPQACINLRFKMDTRNTKNPTVLREFQMNANSLELICYPNHLLNAKRTISLNDLSQEQILLFEKALNKQA